MITKDNVLQARYLDPENTMIEVLYNGDDGKTRKFNFPARPTTSRHWKILKETGWTAAKLKTQTIEWVRSQRRMQEKFAASLSKSMAEKGIAEGVAAVQVAEAQKYDDRIQDITSASQSGDQPIGADLYSLIKEVNSNDEAVFKFKLAALEDESLFEGMTKTAEKTKRREIRKAKTIAEVMEASK